MINRVDWVDLFIEYGRPMFFTDLGFFPNLFLETCFILFVLCIGLRYFFLFALDAL